MKQLCGFLRNGFDFFTSSICSESFLLPCGQVRDFLPALVLLFCALAARWASCPASSKRGGEMGVISWVIQKVLRKGRKAFIEDTEAGVG